MDRITDLSLLSGPVPWLIVALGGAGALWLLAGRQRWFVRAAVPGCAVLAIGTTVGLYAWVEKVWRPFPDPLPKSIYVWIGLCVGAAALMVPRMSASTGWPARALSLVATVAVIATAAAQINLMFAAYPRVRDALGLPDKNWIAFADLPGPTAAVVRSHPLESRWRPATGVADAGRVSSQPIPGPGSGFVARDAEFYFPPAYFADPRPLLPVLVLLPGQPGGPTDWLAGGKLAETMDTFAAQHFGLAPVVVVVDATGSQLGNPLCLDSHLGNVATYLARDVPAWVKAHVQVDPDPRAWAIGGLSYGGTCAIQMATTHPEIYPTFLDMSGQKEPTLGDRTWTVDAAFGGNETAFESVNPLDIMHAHAFPESAGAFLVGADDNEFGPDQRLMFTAAQAAGMSVTYTELPGGHSWSVWSAGLGAEIDWLTRRVGLTP